MEPAVQDPEGHVVVARDDDQLMVGTDARVAPDEQSVLGDSRGGDVARQVAERRPHALPRLDVPPPVGAGDVSAVPLAHRVDTVLHPPERSSYSAASPSDIVHPKSTIHFPAGRLVRSIRTSALVRPFGFAGKRSHARA